MTTLLLALTLAFGGQSLPIQIERAPAGEIAYGFGHARAYGDCALAPGLALAQDVNLFGRHVLTTVRSGDCAVAVLPG